MKCLVVLCFMGLVALCMGEEDLHPRGCIYIEGSCFSECEEGTHSYTTGCGYMTPEATCDEPHPVEDKSGQICDYTACHCDSPTVRDTKSNKCVPLDQCPKKKED